MEIIERLMFEDLYLITFGALEYGSEMKKPTQHRKYFQRESEFRNVVNIEDKGIIDKIHIVHRLEYLRDTAIVGFIERNINQVINMIVQKYNCEIIQYFIINEGLFERLFSFIQNSNNIACKRDCCLFLSKLIKIVRESRCHSYLDTIIEYGLIRVVDYLITTIPIRDSYQKYLDALRVNSTVIDKNSNSYSNSINDEDTIKLITVEILVDILTISSDSIREYIINDNSQMLIALSKIMLCHEHFGLLLEISQVFKTIIENDSPLHKNKFDELLFNNALLTLTTFLSAQLTGKSQVFTTKQIIIEILCSYIVKFEEKIEEWIIANEICIKVINVVKDKNKICTLHVIKFIKEICLHMNYSFCALFVNDDVMKIVKGVFNENKKKQNLIFSAICDLFNSLYEKKEEVFLLFLKLDNEFFYGNENKEYFVRLTSKIEDKNNNELYFNGEMNNYSFDEITFQEEEFFNRGEQEMNFLRRKTLPNQ